MNEITQAFVLAAGVGSDISLISETVMGQILIRNLDDAALERLRIRANELSVPLERLIRDAIHDLARPTHTQLWEEADRLREAIGHVSGDSTELIRRDRDSR